MVAQRKKGGHQFGLRAWFLMVKARYVLTILDIVQSVPGRDQELQRSCGWERLGGVSPSGSFV
jgi:sigma54-dependent transcription regulator